MTVRTSKCSQSEPNPGEISETINTLAAELGRVPVRREVVDHTPITVTHIRDHYPNYDTALDAANLPAAPAGGAPMRVREWLFQLGSPDAQPSPSQEVPVNG